MLYQCRVPHPSGFLSDLPQIWVGPTLGAALFLRLGWDTTALHRKARNHAVGDVASCPRSTLNNGLSSLRNLARFLRQMESKDLRFRPSTFLIYFWDGIPAQPMPAKSTQKRSLFAFCCGFSANLSPFRRSARRPLPIPAVGPFAALEGDIQCRHSTRINATIRRLLRTGTGSATRRKPCADRCSEILQW